MKFFWQFRSSTLPSFLTIIAIALGVAVVTAVAAFLDISRQTQTEFINSLEARTITLQISEDDYNAFSGDDTLVREVGLMDDVSMTLTEEDMMQAKAATPSVDYAYVSTGTCIYSDSFNFSSERIAVSKDYFDAHNISFSRGSGFATSDFEQRRRVAVVSSRFVNLFGLQGDPIGQVINALDCDSYFDFEIVGVMSDETAGNFSGERFPDLIVPFRPDEYNAMNPLSFVVKDIKDLNEARAELETFASKTWNGRVTVHSQNLEVYRSQQRSSGLLIAALASVGLVSAALNIMNLLLARVFKRRRETGILRSLGATRTAIRNQYLSDALILGSVGGLAGVILGYALVFVFNSYVSAATSTFSPSPSLLALAIGFVSALGMSAAFALYPAFLAARLNIVEALREL
jgi:ABC-type antimicrobial peptide transport system permease subunit